MQSRWQESERILSILRSIKPAPDEITPEAMQRWYAEAEKHSSPLKSETFFSEHLAPPRIDTPSEWFRTRFPKQVKVFGQAFLEEIIDDRVPRPVLLNADTIAACLCGDKGLVHQVVFCPWENQWYFHDPVVEAFCPTSTAKLQILASNYLVQCAQSFTSKLTIFPLMTEFRQPSSLQLITNKAKAILQIEKSFFHGPHGKVRLIDDYRINPADEPGHLQFAKNVTVRLQGSKITMSEAHARYVQFCHREHLPVLTPAEAKKSLAEVIEEIYGLGLRHDVHDSEGRQQHGWVGLACKPLPV